MSVVLVCGGRDYDDRAHVFDVLDGIHGAFPIVRIIEGGASGADRLAREWAGERWIPRCGGYSPRTIDFRASSTRRTTRGRRRGGSFIACGRR